MYLSFESLLLGERSVFLLLSPRAAIGRCQRVVPPTPKREETIIALLMVVSLLCDTLDAMTRALFTLTPVMPVQRRESENALQAKASSTRWDQGMLRHVYVTHD